MKRRSFISVLGASAVCGSSFAGQTSAPSSFAIAGTVVHAGTNAPLSKVLVQIRSTEAKGDGSMEVVTGPDGRFSFTNLPAHKFSLTALRPGGAPQSYLENEPYSSALVTGTGQETSNIIFPFHMPGTLALTLLDEINEPVRQASVHLFLHTIDESGIRRIVSTSAPVAHSAGRYRFSHMRPGNYVVGVAARPWFTEQRMSRHSFGPQKQPNPPEAPDPQFDVVYPFTFYPNAIDPGSASTVIVAEGNETALQMNLRAVPAVHARLSSPETRPGSGNNVQVFTLGPEGSAIPLNASAFAQNGEGELTGLAAGRYQLLISTFGMPAPQGQSAIVTVGENVRSGFSRKIVDVVDGATIDLTGGARVAVKGTIRIDGNERPTNRVGLRLQDVRTGQAVQAIAGPDDSIHFAEANISPGAYRVVLTNVPQFRLLALEAKGAQLSGNRLILEDNADVQLSILIGRRSSVKLEGLALLGDVPAVGAMVLLLPKTASFGSTIYRDQSDSDGSFLLRDVAAGNYHALAIDDGRYFAFGEAAAITPYLPGAIAVTIGEAPAAAALRVPVQRRIVQTA